MGKLVRVKGNIQVPDQPAVLAHRSRVCSIAPLYRLRSCRRRELGDENG
jgi:hypothetical protein